MRHWIIDKDVDFSGEITWGVGLLKIKPTYFVMTQNNPNLRECINAYRDIPKWLWSGFRVEIGEVENTTWVERCKRHHYYAEDNYMKRAESWHLPEICTAFSDIGAAMQLAYLNGATEICLLGNGNTQVHRVASRSCPVPIRYEVLHG